MRPSLEALDLIQERAVPTDSCMTSPSYPVLMTWPVPGNLAVSIRRALPPT